MNFLLVLAYGISLSMDAFAVSVCKGLSLGKVRARDCFKVGTYFGIFQGIMPLLGYFILTARMACPPRSMRGTAAPSWPWAAF